jgi:hypothetical protein
VIRHTVAFGLKHDPDSDEERAFLADGSRILAAIPGVERFEALRQVGSKNAFTFGFSMEFADASAYQAYNEHPDHQAFVRDRWEAEVEEFLEIDYAPLT